MYIEIVAIVSFTVGLAIGITTTYFSYYDEIKGNRNIRTNRYCDKPYTKEEILEGYSINNASEVYTFDMKTGKKIRIK